MKYSNGARFCFVFWNLQRASNQVNTISIKFERLVNRNRAKQLHLQRNVLDAFFCFKNMRFLWFIHTKQMKLVLRKRLRKIRRRLSPSNILNQKNAQKYLNTIAVTNEKKFFLLFTKQIIVVFKEFRKQLHYGESLFHQLQKKTKIFFTTRTALFC